jgi:hypothetical protein
LPGPVLEVLKRHKRMSGGAFPITKDDLRVQMSTRPYWVAPPATHGNRRRFGKSRTLQVCWVIDVDKHDEGLNPVTDEEFHKSLYRDGDEEKGIFLPTEEWIDPRKGDLFALIDMLVKAKERAKSEDKDSP